MKNGRKPLYVITIFVSLLLFASAVFTTVKGFADQVSVKSSLILSCIEIIVEGLAGLLIVAQLKSDSDNEKQENLINKERFMLEYNTRFLSDSTMSEIESYLGKRFTQVGNDMDFHGADGADQQKLVNYMVYLEGISSCLLKGVLDIETADDLLSYRYFLAMNHPKVFEICLKSYSQWYKGNIKLYGKWIYHKYQNQRSDKFLGLPNFDTRLTSLIEYEKFIDPPINIQLEEVKNKLSFVGYCSAKKHGDEKPVFVCSFDDICKVVGPPKTGETSRTIKPSSYNEIIAENDWDIISAILGNKLLTKKRIHYKKYKTDEMVFYLKWILAEKYIARTYQRSHSPED